MKTNLSIETKTRNSREPITVLLVRTFFPAMLTCPHQKPTH